MEVLVGGVHDDILFHEPGIGLRHHQLAMLQIRDLQLRKLLHTRGKIDTLYSSTVDLSSLSLFRKKIFRTAADSDPKSIRTLLPDRRGNVTVGSFA